MRTLDCKPIESRRHTAKETLEIYAPFAGRLGMSQIKVELEDLAMYYLYPEAYSELKEKVQAKLTERHAFIDQVCLQIETRLSDMGIEGEVYGRPKHFYSIFNKMRKQNKAFEEIYDLVAVRVIVDSVKDCYAVLGIVHTMWTPMPGRFKDYIAMKKANNYQSLHTTVIMKSGTLFEVQIRTKAMHEIAEYGIAAHWKYKNPNLGETDYSDRLSFIKSFMDAGESLTDNREFLDIVKTDIVQHELIVLTPKGKPIDLPVGSTGIDFAYNIHSELGNKCVGIKINDKMVPIDTKLQNGDIVEVITSSNSKGPSRDWLKIVRTTSAKSKIHQFFKREMKEDNIKRGREMLESEARHKGYGFDELMQGKGLADIMKRYLFSSEDDMFASVGYGGMSTKQILFKLVEGYKKDKKNEYKDSARTSSEKKVQTGGTGGIIINGYNEQNARFASCCNPLPGDDIVAYISKGRGVAVHRSDCTNLKGLDAERLQKVEWPAVLSGDMTANIRVTVVDRKGIFSEISSLVNNLGFSLEAFQGNLIDEAGGITKGDIKLSIKIKSMDDLNTVLNKIRAAKDVIDASRY